MLRTTTALSLLLASGMVAATQEPTAPAQKEERPTLTSYGEVRSGGNAFSPVYTFQQIPAKQRVAPRKAKETEKARRPEPATPAQAPGQIQEL